MSSDEERLRQLKNQAEQRRRDYESARAKAYSIRERLSEELARLKDEFGCESLEDAERLIVQREGEFAELLKELEDQLA